MGEGGGGGGGEHRIPYFQLFPQSNHFFVLLFMIQFNLSGVNLFDLKFSACVFFSNGFKWNTLCMTSSNSILSLKSLIGCCFFSTD